MEIITGSLTHKNKKIVRNKKCVPHCFQPHLPETPRDEMKEYVFSEILFVCFMVPTKKARREI